VVIPTFNRKDSIADVLRPVLDDPATGEVVVIVDGSPDGTFELLTIWSQTDHRIRAIFTENVGDGAARQRGVEEATLDVIVLLDDDVIATPGLIGAHARHHQPGQRQVVVGYMPTHLPQPRRPGQVITYLYAKAYELQCDEYDKDAKSILNNFWMGNISISRACALEVGFKPKIPIRRHSDMEFGFRCQEMNIEAVFDRSLLASHSHTRTLRQFATQCQRSGEARAKLAQTYDQMASRPKPPSSSSRWKERSIPILAAPIIHSIVVPLLMALTFTAGRLKRWKLETRSAELISRIEHRRGFTSIEHVEEDYPEETLQRH